MSVLQAVFVLSVWLATAKGDDHIRLKWLERDFDTWMWNIGGTNDKLEVFDLDLAEINKEDAEFFLNKLTTTINKEKLSEADQLEYTFMKNMLDTYIDGYEWRNWNYLTPISWLEGQQRNPAAFVYNQYFQTRGDFENYIVLLTGFPQLFRQYQTFFSEAIRLGRTSNIRSLCRVPGQIDEIISVAPEDSVYYQPFNESLDQYQMTGPDPDGSRADIRRRGKHAVQLVLDAYRELKDYIVNVYMNHTRESAGVGALAGGADYYMATIKWYLSVEMTPEEIHDLGIQEVSRITAAMKEIMEKQGYHGYSAREYFAEINKQENMYFETEEEIIQEYENIIKNRIDPKLSKLFKDRPILPLKVIPMPSAGSSGAYEVGDGTRASFFYVNTKLKNGKYRFLSLAMHEANPGHHLQMSYALTASLPQFRKHSFHGEKFRVPFNFPLYTVFIEGWALYAESLAVELGIIESDIELMGHYDSEIFRATRLVVDTGIHYFNWTHAEAVEYFMNNTALSLDAIKVEVDRYITWPGHALTYKIGEIWIKKLRKLAENELGDLFDVRDFHKTILEKGYMPLNILEQTVTRWIADVKRTSQNEAPSEECECEETPAPSASPQARGKVRCRRSSPVRPGTAGATRRAGVVPVATSAAVLVSLALCQFVLR